MKSIYVKWISHIHFLEWLTHPSLSWTLLVIKLKVSQLGDLLNHLPLEQDHIFLNGRDCFTCLLYPPSCPFSSPITIANINFSKYLQSKGMSPKKPELKAARENHPIYSIWICSIHVLNTKGSEKVRRRRVMEMEGANSKCYLWPRKSLWLSCWLFSRGKQLQISRGRPWK